MVPTLAGDDILATKIFEDVYMIDSGLLGIPRYTCCYLVVGDRCTLIEAASTSCASTVLREIRAIGIKPTDVSQIVLTHIHLDHAGGAGSLSQVLRNARVLVHPSGVKHLIDPSSLLESARRFIGDRVVDVYGRITPIPARKVCGLVDGEAIKVDKDRSLVVMFAPGHAGHQICLVDRKNGAVFTGDAAGVKLNGMSAPMPATGSPDFDLNMATRTLRRIRCLRPKALLFTHFGPAIDEVDRIIVDYSTILKRWKRTIAAALTTDRPLEDLAREIVEHFALSNVPLPREVLLQSIRVNAQGYACYLKKKCHHRLH